MKNPKIIPAPVKNLTQSSKKIKEILDDNTCSRKIAIGVKRNLPKIRSCEKKITDNTVEKQVTEYPLKLLIEDERDKRDRKDKNEERKLKFLIILTALVFIVLIIILLRNYKDLLIPVITGILTFIGGYGMGLGKTNKRSL